MHTKIPNKAALEKNRKNLQKMMNEEYPENINKTMVQIVHVCKAHDMEIQFYIEKFLSDLKNDRIKKMLYLDAFFYLHPDKVEE